MKVFLLLLFTLFGVANLNAMQQFKRALPILLKNKVKLTPRQYQHLAHVVRHNGLNAMQLSQLVPRINYCPARSFSSQVPNEQNEQSWQIIRKQKQKLMLEKVLMLLEDENFKDFLKSDECEEILKYKLNKINENEEFKKLLEVNAKIILNDKALLKQLIQNESFLCLIKKIHELEKETNCHPTRSDDNDNTVPVVVSLTLLWCCFMVYIANFS